MQKQRRILLVEDDTLVASAIQNILMEEGYEILATVRSGTHAIQVIDAQCPDLVFMDIELPGEWDGIQTAEHIRTRHDIPIIYLTGHSEPELFARAKQTNPYGYLLKPFQMREVLASVETALYRHNMERQLKEANQLFEQEIAERRRTEKALQKNEDRFRRISELVSDYAYIFDVTPDGWLRREWATEAFTRITGYAPDEVDKQGGWISLVHPKDQDIIARHRQHVLAGNESIVEYRIINKHGDIFWLRDYSRPVWDASRKRVVKVFGAAQDITDNKRAEEALRTSQQQLAATLRSIGDAVIATDNAGTVTFLNPVAEALTGWTQEEAMGRHIGFKIVDHRAAGSTAVSSSDVPPSDITIDITASTVLITKDGTTIPIEYSGAPIKDEKEHVNGMVVVLKDISERQRVEKERYQLEAQLRQSQRLEAIGTLAGGIAHDFNNILGTMLGYTELLLEDHPHQNTERTFLERIYQAGERARDLIRQILAFSRTQEYPKLSPIAIGPILDEALNMIRATIPANIVIRRHLQADCPSIRADATQIHQVIVNLCVNAAHAMKATGGILEVTLETVNYPGNHQQVLDLTQGAYVKLTIKDTGCGMPPEIQEHIFEPFFTTKAAGEGTGLGLSVAHGIVKSHHGLIAFESEPGKGTQFRLFFPVADERIRHEDVVETSPDVQGHESILLVDDELELAKLYEIALTRRGYHVTTCTNSVEALRVFQNEPEFFDLVIADQDMATMTGAQLSQYMLQIRSDIPIFLMTGFHSELSDDILHTPGICELWMKPVKVGELVRAIRTVLARRKV